MSICQWDSTLVKVKMVVRCILEMESSYLKSRTQRLATEEEPLERIALLIEIRDPLAIQGEHI